MENGYCRVRIPNRELEQVFGLAYHRKRVELAVA